MLSATHFRTSDTFPERTICIKCSMPCTLAALQPTSMALRHIVFLVKTVSMLMVTEQRPACDSQSPWEGDFYIKLRLSTYPHGL